MTADREKIRNRRNGIFRNVFDDDDLEINDATRAEDIDEWDSLMHVTLMVVAEKEFGMRLNAAEVGELDNVGALIDLISERATK